MMLMELPVYNIGDVVEKYTGDYTAQGEVRGYFYTHKGKLRYVVEIPPGFLMVYSSHVLRLPSVGNDEPELFDATETGYFSVYDIQEHQDGESGWKTA